MYLSVFVPVKFPNEDLLNLLATCSEFKSKTVCRLYFTEEGFTHIENGNWSRVTDTIPRNTRSKIAPNSTKQHLPLPELLNHERVIMFKHFDIYLLQETHLPDVKQGKLWENQWGSPALWSLYKFVYI